MLTEEQKANWAQLLEILKSTPERMYKHSLFYHDLHSAKVNAQQAREYHAKKAFCGTVACALGWAGIFGIGGLSLSSSGNDFFLNNEEAGTKPAADTVFGDGAYDAVFSSLDDNRNHRHWDIHDAILAAEQFIKDNSNVD